MSINNKLLIDSIISSTEMSLALSHLHCVIDAKLNGYKSILICEDDIQFVSNFKEKFTQFIKDVPVEWATSKYVEAEPGYYITTARKDKNSNNWW